MRLLTHNLLACHAKGCGASSNNFPLHLRNVQLELIDAEYNDVFLKGFLPKLHWPALVFAAQQLGQTALPEQEPDFTQQEPSDELLHALHHILLELHITEGEMVCPNCEHVYTIRSGIPNMVRPPARSRSSSPSMRFPNSLDRPHTQNAPRRTAHHASRECQTMCRRQDMV